jgi:hypothetical protein
VRLNALHPDFYFWYLAPIYVLSRQFHEAVATVDRIGPTTADVPAWRAIALAHLGQHDAASAAAEQFRGELRKRWLGRAPPTDKDMTAWLESCYVVRRAEDRALLTEGLRRAGVDTSTG